ncbi:MAG: hypothetical protein NW201_05735 [Gemmatimonadales bacterium]|nr:hypothetical protein [Gemmatimonadales bacterium]
MVRRLDHRMVTTHPPARDGLRLDFEARLLLVPPATRLRTSMGPGTVRIEGHLSTGSRGWRLEGAVARHRNRLDLFVRARRADPGAGEGIEDHAYAAVLGPLRAGRWRLRVRHLFGPADGDGVAEPLTVLEETIVVE